MGRAFFVSAGLMCQDEEHDSMSEKGRSWVGRLYSGACTVCRETSRLAGEQVKIQASRQDLGDPIRPRLQGRGGIHDELTSKKVDLGFPCRAILRGERSDRAMGDMSGCTVCIYDASTRVA